MDAHHPGVTYWQHGHNHLQERRRSLQGKMASGPDMKRGGGYRSSRHPPFPRRPLASQKTQCQDTSVPDVIVPSFVTL